ncbi:hypothetical protein [Burkholderia sp. SRS-W-2-2016]|nr:hypothetical protein [Burkholderia sp. SRS-W-2-2016]
MTLFYEALVAPFYASADDAFTWARKLTDWNLQAGRSLLATGGSARPR